MQKTKIMASGPITSWQTDGKAIETVTDFILWGSKITADGDCSHEIKRRLLLGRKVITNLDSFLKSRDTTFLTKGHLVQAIAFPAVLYGCESWTIKKAERQRIDAFELWCWRRFLRVLGLQGDPTSPSYRKSVLDIHWKDWCWIWNSKLWTPDAKNWLIGRDTDAGKDWRQEKGTTVDELVRWHHWLNRCEFE